MQSQCVFRVLKAEVRRLGSEVRSLKSEVRGLTDPIDVQNALERSQGANGGQGGSEGKGVDQCCSVNLGTDFLEGPQGDKCV